MSFCECYPTQYLLHGTASNNKNSAEQNTEELENILLRGEIGVNFSFHPGKVSYVGWYFLIAMSKDTKLCKRNSSLCPEIHRFHSCCAVPYSKLIGWPNFKPQILCELRDYISTIASCLKSTSAVLGTKNWRTEHRIGSMLVVNDGKERWPVEWEFIQWTYDKSQIFPF